MVVKLEVKNIIKSLQDKRVINLNEQDTDGLVYTLFSPCLNWLINIDGYFFCISFE